MPHGSSRTAGPYRISIALILAAGAFAAFWVYRDGRRGEEQAAAFEFERRASTADAFTREVLQRYTDAMYGLATLFTVDATVSPEQFTRLAEQLQPRLSGALAFEWAPYVPIDRRPEFEAQLATEYAPLPFHIIEFDEDGRMHPAAPRSHYYPLSLVAPLRGNEIVLGYDVLTAPSRQALDRSRATRELTVTRQFRLRQETGNQLGIVMVLPVFRAPRGETAEVGAPADSTQPAGYLQFVFHARELLAQASPDRSDGALEMLVVDSAEPDAAHAVLFTTVPAAAGAPLTAEAFVHAAPFSREYPLPIGEGGWRAYYRPSSTWLNARRTAAPFWRAVTLLSLSGLLAGFVRVIARRTEVIRREVRERTAELTESRRQFANMLHSLPGMAYRASYGDPPRMLFVSEGAFALTGWRPEELVAGEASLAPVIHPNDLDRVRAEIRAALAAGGDLEQTYRIRTRDGAEKWVLSRGRRVETGSGKVPDVIEGIIIDITEQKRAEESRLALDRKLLETQKLESLGLLAGGIAHDFNNLLSAILGNATLARMTLEPGNAADAQLRAVEGASLRAAELCRQMLAYAGKGRFVVERVDLSAVVEDLLPLLRVSIARSAVLHLELTPKLPGVKADATQIRQIVMNLVLNAVDAVAGRNGEIRVQTGTTPVDKALLGRCVTGQGLPLGEYVYLEVSDTGSGMTPEVMAKIFDPFYTTKFAGRGLGLAAVLGIVRGHNGALLVESEPGKGSRFRLFLPPIMGEVTARETPPAPEPAERWHSTGDVLVAEDEEPVRVVIVELLKSFGFAVHAVPDGRSAVEAFRENASKWTLVIIDLLMPGMSGEETLGALQAIKADVRVLLVSGYSEGEIMKRVHAPSRVGFLPKPFKREAFEAKLKELFS